jgi:hypothetical protein
MAHRLESGERMVSRQGTRPRHRDQQDGRDHRRDRVAPYPVFPLATHAIAETMAALAAWLGLGAGRRLAFILTGVFSPIWLDAWPWLYRKPRQSALFAQPELDLIEQSGATENRANSAEGCS